MPRWCQALLAAVMVALVLACLTAIGLDVAWELRHPAEAAAADQAAWDAYWHGQHQVLLQRRSLHQSLWPCVPCPACPP